MSESETESADGTEPGRLTRLGAFLRAKLVPSTPREAVHLLALVVLLAIVIPFVIFAIPQVVGAEQSYVVLSGSMEPAVSPGDVVIVNAVPASAVEVGDVITYGGSQTSPPTTHRVIDIQQQDGELVFETKGDNNENADIALTPASTLRGKVMELPVSIPGNGHNLFVIPFIGYVAQFAQTQLGFLLLVGIPLFLLAVSEFWRFITLSREEAEKREPESATESDEQPTYSAPQSWIFVAVAALAGAGGFGAHYAYQNQEPVIAAIAVGALVGGILLAAMLVVQAEPANQEPDSGDPAAQPQPDGEVNQ
ncbi:signal peptidase I [Halodesulfurarchaeum sp. HSR-GB]|uniref:signal peptidase I n=1 Tax=Halodesulfurarchaeum sp. HSR-GB TaxID=3074077 RepID=UPI00285659CA|nr:signal peptidase I [Halodesulfurarchaeum sp. HSR-GB]MDR5657351.1 signal peptidase I [Halodesulfurarchaeum sp. HSR-GB]